MIRRVEIGKLAYRHGVPERTIQKDYIITCVLRELARVMPSVGLRFKGGTCLKKCYFADFRFSEDMDFTLEGSAGTEAALEALEEVERPLLDSYSDAGPSVTVRCYSLDEIFLEKVVCLLDPKRIQPRDLYDLVQLADGGSVDFQGVAWRFEQKARFKGLEPARLHDAMVRKSAQLKRAWEMQLAEQLPTGALPGYEDCERQMLRLLKKHGFTD
ncbi:MAG: nucleotidyl transferase AbiEii/AbiGii toxin family protein [Coriobacteriia bacterium]